MMGRTIIYILLALGLTAGCSRQEEAPRPASNGRNYQERMAAFRQEKEARTAIPKLQTSIRNFHRELGRLPNDLLELSRLGYIDTIPQPPPGYTYHYDNERGNIRFVQMQ